MWLGLAGFGVVFMSAALMLGLTFLRRKSPPTFREIPAFVHLKQAIGRVVEDGSRLHVSLGRGSLTTPQSAPALAGLSCDGESSRGLVGESWMIAFMLVMVLVGRQFPLRAGG